jgi:TonB family protein
MFETSVVQAQAKAATGRFSLLSVSVVAHTAIVVGAVAVSIASVDFPYIAPNEYSRAPVFATLQIPPPLGHPNGGAPKPKEPQVAPVQKPPVNQVTAPSTVPETVTPADTPSTGPTDTTTSGTGTVEGPIGVPWGTKDSTGDLNAPPVADLPAQPVLEEKIYQPHEVVAPVLLARVDPRYPAHMTKAGVSATVVVRCVIDKTGHVRDAEVVVPAAMAPFNAEVLRVISQWRYKPATYAGHVVDSYLTLTVHFAVNR